MPPRSDITAGNPPYAPALVRPVSPVSSIGTRLPKDATSEEDRLLSQEQFDEKCWDALKVDAQTDEELEAEKRPIRYQYDKLETGKIATLHEQVQRRLRDEVQKLRENELFEQALLRGSQVGLEYHTTSGDIDAIMRSMLEPSGKDELVANAGESVGPSIMTNQIPFYPEREVEFSELPAGNIDTTRTKGKRKA